MNWTAYVVLADGIKPADLTIELTGDDDMARARSVISRCYYGVFHVAWRYVLANKILPRMTNTGKDHGDVWQALMGRGRSADERVAGGLGDSLMDSRHRADYLTTVRALHKDAGVALTSAVDIHRLLKQPYP